MATVRQITLFRREIRESVSPAALEVLLGSAGRISEGQSSHDGRYYGSTMLTIDLSRIQIHVKDRCDVATARRLARLMEKEGLVRHLAGQLAMEEAQRISNRKLHQTEVEVRVRAEGQQVFIDIDVEAEAQAALGRRS